MECPDEDQLVLWVEGALLEKERERLDEHVDACSRCMTLVAALSSVEPTADEPQERLAHPVPAGSTLLMPGACVGRYIIRDLAGAGATGMVYEAFDPDLGRRVALKVLRIEWLAMASGRLLREAKALARLSHPNTVQVHDAGRWAGGVFLAMEFVSGRTLRAWLREREHKTEEILRILIQAGRGLEAAHGAGIVHRDFKPSNVLVGDDGRVRVADFGLAALHGEPAESRERGAAAGESRDALATSTGSVIGTPAYMSPEQAGGQSATALSDQFSFGVVLYEALFGVRPPAPDEGASLFVARTRTDIAPAVLRALARSLSADPKERYPGMTSLLAELEGRTRSRRSKFALGAALLLLATGLATFWALSGQRNACAEASTAAAEVWNEQVQRNLRQSLTSVGAPFAQATWEIVKRGVDAYVSRWNAEGLDACEAGRRTRTPALADRRRACLDTQLGELRSLLAVLQSSDLQTWRNAASAVALLPHPGDCRTPQSRSYASTSPSMDASPQTSRLLADARALKHAGRFSEALMHARSALELADKSGQRQLVAEGALEVGTLEERLDDPTLGERDLLRAVFEAEALGYDWLTARAWTALIAVAARRAAWNKADEYASHAHALLERMGGHAELRAELAYEEGLWLAAAIKPGEAGKKFRESIALAEPELGRRHPYVLRALSRLGEALHAERRFAEALETFESVLEPQRSLLGDQHPDLAATLNGAGGAALALGDMARARAHMHEAQTILEATLGTSHRELVPVLHNMAHLHHEDEQLDRARDTLLRAIGISEATQGVDHPKTAHLLSLLGIVRRESGDLVGARADFERVDRIWLMAFGPDHIYAASSLENLGTQALAEGNADEALRLGKACLARVERTMPNNAVELAYPLALIGRAHVAKREPDLAIAPLRQALALRLNGSGGANDIAETRFALAEALWAGGDRTTRVNREAEARDLVLKALEAWERAGQSRARRVERAKRWLDAHPASAGSTSSSPRAGQTEPLGHSGP